MGLSIKLKRAAFIQGLTVNLNLKSRAWPADSGRRMRPVCTDSGELAVRKSPEIGRQTQ